MQAAQHIAQQFSVLAVPTRRRGTSRFSLYLLEHGELFLYDFGGTLDDARGRLRCCSRSLVFEPADARAPLLKFPLRNVERLAHDNDGVAFSTTLYYELLANNIAAPFVKRTTFTERRFRPDHADPTELVKKIERIQKIAERVAKEGPHVEFELLQPVTSPLKTARFDASMLEDFDEDVRGRFVCERIAPLTKLPGVLAITSKRVYFQPAPLNDCGDGRVTLSLNDVVTITPGRHLLRDTALEINARRTLLRIAFSSTEARDACLDVLPQLSPPSLVDATRAWQRRDLDTFSYLAILNQLSGRSVHDLSQYPVYPWVLADYASRTLDLEDPSSFRDLSKPVGALNAKRLATFRERYRHMAAPPLPVEAPKDTSYETKIKEGFSGLIAQTAFGRKLVQQPSKPPPPPPVEQRDEDAPFLYGTHYSTPGYVLFFLVRVIPEFMLCLQNGKFDAPDRMFDSVQDAFDSVCNAPTDVKELVPEFYSGDGSFLKNDRNIPLGSTQSGRRLHDVTLPPWCASPADFVKRHREALESDYVSQRIHLWIDLIFGRKQRSIEDDNVFHPLTYEGIDLNSVGDPRRRAAFSLQIDEFGQTPRRLFGEAHPPRDGPLAVDVKPPPVKKPPPVVKRAPTLAPTPVKKAAPKPVMKPAPPPAPVRSPTAFLTKAPAPSLKLRPFPRASVDRRRPRLPTKPIKLALKKTARPHRDAPTDVSSAAGKIATAARDGTLRVSRLRDDGALVSVRQLVAASKKALTASQLTDDGNCVICCGWDCAISVYDAATGSLLRRLDDAHDAAVACGRLRGSVFCTGAWDATVKLWSVSDLCGDGECGPFLELVDHEAPVTCIALSSNASLVVAGADDGALLVWDARPASKIDRAPVGDAIISIAAPVVCVDICSDRILAAAEDGLMKEVALDGGELRRFDLSGEPRCLVAAEAARGALYLVAGRADGSLALVAWDEHEAPEERYVVEKAHGAALSAVTVAEGGALVSCADDCSAATWDFVSDDVDGVAV
ncbi:unnamed protein product [Pelagomonas calceolata]|uniref:BEACH domain-containing protein n=1 Tax=Pelagomonas calceolata TaxID=35677 RepID=A0A8J2S5K1_9STRA|nr:unnamed protein product [Pelagomonas calceolata]